MRTCCRQQHACIRVSWCLHVRDQSASHSSDTPQGEIFSRTKNSEDKEQHEVKTPTEGQEPLDIPVQCVRGLCVGDSAQPPRHSQPRPSLPAPNHCGRTRYRRPGFFISARIGRLTRGHMHICTDAYKHSCLQATHARTWRGVSSTDTAPREWSGGTR